MRWNGPRGCFSSGSVTSPNGWLLWERPSSSPSERPTCERTLKRNPIRALESVRCRFFSFPSLASPVGQGKVSGDTPGEPSLESEIKKLSQITSRSGIHNNKPAIYLPVSGLPPREASRSKKWLRSINISFFSFPRSLRGSKTES